MPTVNITCTNDADFVQGFQYKVVDGPPINLAGNIMRMGIRHTAEAVIEDLLLTTENGGITINDAANGLFTVFISKEQLMELQPGDYAQSLIRTVDGYRLRVWSGTLTNSAGPSR